MKYGYVKGKSEGVIERQLNTLKAYNLDEIIVEKSGKDLDALINRLQAGDELYVVNIDRLAKDLSKLVEISESIKEKGATICTDQKTIEQLTRLYKSFISM